MLNALKFIVSLAVAIVVMLIVRAYAFTICTVSTDSLMPSLKRGEKVFVNRLSKNNIHLGDLVVYGDSTLGISRVAAMNGDTISVGDDQYVINNHCTGGCTCGHCRNYLLVSGNDSAFISGNDIIGKAYALSLRLRGKQEDGRR